MHMPCQPADRSPLSPVALLVVLCGLMHTGSPVSEVAAQPRDLGREPRYRRVCYYTNWSQYRKEEGRFLPANIDPFLCTHIVFAFAKVDSRGQLAPYEWNDIQYPYLYRQFNDLKKKNPHLKTLLAVGGWTHGSGPFTQMVKDKVGRRAFLEHALQYLRTHGFDGLDLDWEYPANRGSPPADKENFSLLIKELREGFENEALRTSQSRLLLTAAVAGGEKIVRTAYDVPKLDKYLDFINLMSYDFHGSWSSSLGHNAPLFGGDFDPAESSTTHSVDEAVRLWLGLGASRDKLVVGIPFYGRSFTSCGSDVKPGMRNCGTGKAGHYTMENGFISFYEMEDKLASGWQRLWLDREKVPYAFHLPTKQWVGYDDIESIKIKAQYIKDKGLGGAMVWSLDLDDFAPLWSEEPYPLARTIREVLDGEFEFPVFKPPPGTGKKRKPSQPKPGPKPRGEKEAFAVTKVPAKKQEPAVHKPDSVGGKHSLVDGQEMKEHIQTRLRLLDNDIKNKVRPDSPLMGLALNRGSASTSTTTAATTRPSTVTTTRFYTTSSKTTGSPPFPSTLSTSEAMAPDQTSKGWPTRQDEKVVKGRVHGLATRLNERPPVTSTLMSPKSSNRAGLPTQPTRRSQVNSDSRMWHFVDGPYKATTTLKPATPSGTSLRAARSSINIHTTSLPTKPSTSFTASVKMVHTASTTTALPSTLLSSTARPEQSSPVVFTVKSSIFAPRSTLFAEQTTSLTSPSVKTPRAASSVVRSTQPSSAVRSTQQAEVKWWEKNDRTKTAADISKSSTTSSGSTTPTSLQLTSRAAWQAPSRAKWWDHMADVTQIALSTFSTPSASLSGSTAAQTAQDNRSRSGDVTSLLSSGNVSARRVMHTAKTQFLESRHLPTPIDIDQSLESLESSRKSEYLVNPKPLGSDQKTTIPVPHDMFETVSAYVSQPTPTRDLKLVNTTPGVEVEKTDTKIVKLLSKEVTETRWPSDVKPALRTIISIDFKSRGDTPLDTGSLIFEADDTAGEKTVSRDKTPASGETKARHPPANSIFSGMTSTRDLRTRHDAASLSTTASTTTSVAAIRETTSTRWWERTTNRRVASATTTAFNRKSTLVSSATENAQPVVYEMQRPGSGARDSRTHPRATTSPSMVSVTRSAVSGNRKNTPEMTEERLSSRPAGRENTVPAVSTALHSTLGRHDREGKARSGLTSPTLSTSLAAAGTSPSVVQSDDETSRSLDSLKVEGSRPDWLARRNWWHKTSRTSHVPASGDLLRLTTQRRQDTTKKCDQDAQVEQFKATGSEPDSMRAGTEVSYDVRDEKSLSRLLALHPPETLFDETETEAVFYPEYQEYDFQCPTVFGIYADPVDCTRFYQCVWLVAFHHVCGPGTVWNDEMKICDWPTAFSCRS